MQINNVIILAGGKGTRLSEQTGIIPKPLLPVGDKPILFHIIDYFVKRGVTNVVIAGGYKFELLRDTIIAARNRYAGSVQLIGSEVHGTKAKSLVSTECSIQIVDTGEDTDTAQRIKMLKEYIPEGENFFLAYGDNVSNVDLSLVERCLAADNDRILALTAVQFCERFGVITIGKDNCVIRFAEKAMLDSEFINGGFMASKYSLFDYIKPTDTDFSKTTLPRLSAQGILGAHLHKDFWYAVDTQRDWEYLNSLYETNKTLFR